MWFTAFETHKMQSLKKLHFSLLQELCLFPVCYILDCVEPVFVIQHKKFQSAALHSVAPLDIPYFVESTVVNFLYSLQQKI